jgi:hypothetical protein
VSVARTNESKVPAPALRAHGTFTLPGRNPSGYSKRALVLTFTLIGFGIAARLAAYQLRWSPPPPEPLFGAGSERVLNSPLSHALPVPDGALGAFAYATEAVLVAIGRTERFATMPLVVGAYATLAILMALTSAGLIVYQLAVVGAACTLCLASALLSLALVVPAVSEAKAAVAAWISNRHDPAPRA